MSALKPEDIVFSLKKPYLLVYSNAPIYLGRPFGCEQADSRERPAFSLQKIFHIYVMGYLVAQSMSYKLLINESLFWRIHDGSSI